MFVSADQILCHMIADYVLQSHWMATQKTKRDIPAVVHALAYGIPFLFLRPSWQAMTVIICTHYVIDRNRLARFVIFAKNHLAPRSQWPKWEDCKETGFHRDVPPWLAVWLLILVDNIIHVCINAAALKWL